MALKKERSARVHTRNISDEHKKMFWYKARIIFRIYISKVQEASQKDRQTYWKWTAQAHEMLETHVGVDFIFHAV